MVVPINSKINGGKGTFFGLPEQKPDNDFTVNSILFFLCVRIIQLVLRLAGFAVLNQLPVYVYIRVVQAAGSEVLVIMTGLFIKGWNFFD